MFAATKSIAFILNHICTGKVHFTQMCVRQIASSVFLSWRSKQVATVVIPVVSLSLNCMTILGPLWESWVFCHPEFIPGSWEWRQFQKRGKRRPEERKERKERWQEVSDQGRLAVCILRQHLILLSFKFFCLACHTFHNHYYLYLFIYQWFHYTTRRQAVLY